MKTFTKIMLSISGTLFCIGAVCILIAGSMGLNLSVFKQMVNEGKLSFDMNDLNIFDNNYSDLPLEIGRAEITEEITHLEIEYGAGTLTIRYGATDHILIETENVYNFKANVEDQILTIEGNIDINGVANTTNSSLTITLPRNTTFEFANLEIGASEATISDLNVGIMEMEIGAGEAELTDIVTDKLSITVGAGEANITNLDAQNFNAEVGIGELNASLVGKETDYNYTIDCGIGSVEIGDTSYDGLGNSTVVEAKEGTRFIVVDCGIGEVDIEFAE